jgi:hypothetical protein
MTVHGENKIEGKMIEDGKPHRLTLIDSRNLSLNESITLLAFMF